MTNPKSAEYVEVDEEIHGADLNAQLKDAFSRTDKVILLIRGSSMVLMAKLLDKIKDQNNRGPIKRGEVGVELKNEEGQEVVITSLNYDNGEGKLVVDLAEIESNSPRGKYLSEYIRTGRQYMYQVISIAKSHERTGTCVTYFPIIGETPDDEMLDAEIAHAFFDNEQPTDVEG